MTEAPTPWTEKEFLAALRAAGWRRESGPARVYVSPDGTRFHLDEYHADIGVLWRHYAARRELPTVVPLQPWQVRLREKIREAQGE